MLAFTDLHFNKFSGLINDRFGIHFNDAKKELLHHKLIKLMMQKELDSFDKLYEEIINRSNKEFELEFLNVITVNKTDFFREEEHFSFIRDNLKLVFELNKRINKSGEIRVWSAGCSTGEEAYTIAMVLKELFDDSINIRILATDISCKVLSAAQRGIYPGVSLKGIDNCYIKRYFIKSDNGFRISEEIKRLVSFRYFNLMNEFPFRSSFDIIFCRNVMIYFNNETQTELINKYYDALTDGGLLFIGHSESLSNKTHSFKYLQPTIYMK
ncbi:MAG: CheR family methyltransferase [Bacillota bacterium]